MRGLEDMVLEDGREWYVPGRAPRMESRERGEREVGRDRQGVESRMQGKVG